MTQPAVTHTCYLVAVLDTRGWVPTVKSVRLSSAPAASATVRFDSECLVDVLHFHADSYHEAAEVALEYLASELGVTLHGWVRGFLPEQDKNRVQELRRAAAFDSKF